MTRKTIFLMGMSISLGSYGCAGSISSPDAYVPSESESNEFGETFSGGENVQDTSDSSEPELPQGPESETFSEDGSTGDGLSDGGTTDDGVAEEAGNFFDCTMPAAAQSWIRSYQQEIISRLTGVSEIAPGQYLGSRSTSQERNLTREYLKTLWEELGLQVRIQPYDTDGANIYALLQATSGSEEWILLGAHMDSAELSPGADDDATGIALVCASARYAAMLPCRSRNLLFVGFDQEEVGIIGGYAFAEYITSEQYQVHSVHDFEMLGWDADGDRLYHLAPPGASLFDTYQQVAREEALPIQLRQAEGGGSDYDAFIDYGFPTIVMSEAWPDDSTPYFHSSLDQYSTINFDYLESATILENLVIVNLTN